MMETDKLTRGVVDLLWEVFAMTIPNTTPGQSLGALMILSMAARADPKVWRALEG